MPSHAFALVSSMCHAFALQSVNCSTHSAPMSPSLRLFPASWGLASSHYARLRTRGHLSHWFLIICLYMCLCHHVVSFLGCKPFLSHSLTHVYPGPAQALVHSSCSDTGQGSSKRSVSEGMNSWSGVPFPLPLWVHSTPSATLLLCTP